MKFNRFLLLIAAQAGLLAGLAQAQVDVATRPSAVTVYPGSARVQRSGKISLPAGESLLIFSGLPARLDESSLRLSAEGVPAKLAGVKLRLAFTDETLQKLQRDLEAKIQNLDDAKADLQDQIAARKAETELLKSLGAQAGQKGAQNAIEKGGPLADFTQSAAAVGRRMAQLNSANRKDERALRELDKKIAAAQAELNNAGAGETRSRVAEALVDLKEAGDLNVELSYLIYGASWAPIYDARLGSESEKPKLKLTFLADVAQNTGEDWNDVKLTLSTARPSEGTQAPDPTQWWLDQRQDYAEALSYNNAPKSAAKARRAKGLAAAMDMSSGSAYSVEPSPAPQPTATSMQIDQAQTLSGEYATSFVIKRSADIKSDGSSQRVAISESTQSAELKLLVVPRLDKAAYVQAHVLYDGEQPLLPGQLSLYQDDNFVGRTQLKSIAPGESFDLGLGKDERVKVERERVTAKLAPGKGFIFSKDLRRYHWLIKIKSLHKGLRDVEVLEQLPRSRHDDIKVKELELLPKPEAEDAEKPGLLRWKLSLKPGEESKITFRYEVKYPEGMDVQGLE